MLPTAGGGSGSSTATSDTPPSDPVDGQLWWNSSSGNLYCWYQDADSGQWVQINTSSSSAITTPQMYGAVGDGVTDDTAALNTALNAANGRLYVPAGQYRISGTLTVPPGTCVEGSGGCDLIVPLAAGTNILVTHTSGTAMLLGRGATLEKVNFWYPDQVTTSPPVVYPYTVSIDHTDTAVQKGNNAGVTIRDIVIHNAYDGIDLGGDSLRVGGANVFGVINLTGIRMYALNTAIRSGHTLNEAFLSNTVISPTTWPQSAAQPCRQWAMTTGGAGILFEAQQGLQIANTVVYGKRWGIRAHNAAFTSATNGNINFLTAVGLTLDGCVTCIEAGGWFGLATARFSGCTFNALDPFNAGRSDCRAVYLNDSQQVNQISFDGCVFGAAHGSHFVDDAPTSATQNNISFVGCQFFNANANSQAGTFYNIYLNDDGAHVNITGCQFLNISAQTTIVCLMVPICARLIVDGMSVAYTAGKHIHVTSAGALSFRGLVDLSTSNVWPTSMPQSLASAATLQLLDTDKEFWSVSGSTAITSIVPSWPGRRITLRGTGLWTLTDGGNLKLNGNFTVVTSNDTISLAYDGVNWLECGRSANGA